MSSDDEDPRADGREEEDAEEGAGGGSDGEEAPKKSKEKKASFVEDEADESGSEGGSGDDDDAEGQDEFEKDGFVVDEADEDEGGDEESEDDSDGEGVGKKKRRKREVLELDEEDEDLIAENMGIDRPKEKKRKRIVKKGGEKEDKGGDDKRTAEEAVRDELFGADEDEGLEDQGLVDDMPQKKPQEEEDDVDEFDEEEDEFADFIVDEEDKYDSDGNLIPRQRKKKKKKKSSSMVSSYALREAQEIFGDVTDLLDMYNRSKQAQIDVADEDLDEDEDMADSDEEGGGRSREDKAKKARAAALRKATRAIDPSLMEKHFFTEMDEQVRALDIPERLQVPVLGAGEPPPCTLDDLEAEAEWVYMRVFHKQAPDTMAKQLVEDGVLEREVQGADRPEEEGYRQLSKTRSSDELREWQESEAQQEDLKASLRAVLGMLNGKDPTQADQEAHRNYYEVPFIAQYRKEMCGQLLGAHEMAHRNYYEVPFISQYRKEMCGQLLAMRKSDRPDRDRAGMVHADMRRVRRWDVLYAVADWDAKWKSLQRRKEGLRAVIEEARDFLPEGAPELEAVDECLEALREASSEEGVDDVDRKFRLRAKPRGPSMDALAVSEGDGGGAGKKGGFKAPVKTTLYEICRRAGMAAVARKFGLTAAEFGENLSEGYMRNGPEDDPSMPEEVAALHKDFKHGMDTPERVLKHARHMLACEIAAEPQVRDFMRSALRDKAVVSTTPTVLGLEVLDPFHPWGKVKRLENKPVKDFLESDDFLRIVAAEREGLLTFQVGLLHPSDLTGIYKHCWESYLSEGVSDSAKAWNEERRLVITSAVEEHLIPDLARGLRAELLSESRDEVLRKVAGEVWGTVSRAPYRPVHHGDGGPEVLEEARVMACCWGDGKPATTFVMLDTAGEMVDVLSTGWLSGRLRAGPHGSDSRKDKDLRRLQAFMEEHRPHVCVVGGAGVECRALVVEIKQVVDKIIEFNPRAMTETGTIEVLMHAETLPRVWEDCPAAREELPEATDITRRAICLGRCLLDPLAVMAGMCGPGKEVLALALDPHQSEVDEPGRISAVERMLVTVVNQAGVDLNLVDSHEWMSSVVPYVAGLGPRKGNSLLKALRKYGGLANRKEVLEELGCIGPVVFRNAAGFLRIRATRGNRDVDILDDTRIHPEGYEYAKQIARDALGEGANDDDDDDGASNIEAAIMNPSKVEELDLIEYDRYVKESTGRGILATLVDVVFEFRHPYVETRVRPWVAPTKSEEFEMLAGVRIEDFREGRVLPATVVSTQRDQVIVETEAGLKGCIPRHELSAEAAQSDECRLDSVVTRGQTLNVCVVKLHLVETPETPFPLELSTRSNRLGERKRWEREYCGRDKWYRVESEEWEEEMRKVGRAEERKVAKAKNKNTAARRPFRERRVDHPLFKNVTLAEATAELADQEVGDLLLRPSQTHGATHLTVTMKFYDNCMAHVDIKEGEKPAGPTSHLRLGLPLTIKHHGGTEEQYEDLDEVLARYIEPRVELIKDMQSHRKFRPEGRDDLDKILEAEKKARPGTFPYYFAVDFDTPGQFYLAYICSTRPRHERVAINPDGYFFRMKTFHSVDQLIGWFKKHYHERIPTKGDQRAAQLAQHAARAPPPMAPVAHAGAPPPMAMAPQQPPPMGPPGMYGGRPGGGGGYGGAPGGGGGYGGAPGAMAAGRGPPGHPPPGYPPPAPPPPMHGGWGGGGGPPPGPPGMVPQRAPPPGPSGWAGWAGGGGWGPGPREDQPPPPRGPPPSAHAGGWQHHGR